MALCDGESGRAVEAVSGRFANLPAWALYRRVIAEYPIPLQKPRDVTEPWTALCDLAAAAEALVEAEIEEDEALGLLLDSKGDPDENERCRDRLKIVSRALL